MSPARSPIAAVVAALARAAPAAAHAKDVNHDGLPDGWERAHRLSLSVNQANRDQDRDGLVNRLELADRTDPRRTDSDRAGIKDGQEDSGHDGVPNRDGAPQRASSTQDVSDDGGEDAPGGSREPATPPSVAATGATSVSRRGARASGCG